MDDVMVDIETLGKGQDAMVVQVGAVFFDRHTGELGQEFKATFDAEKMERAGFRADASTVKWWLSQSEAARSSILNSVGANTVGAIEDLRHFLDGAKKVWSHATFDFVILQNTFKKLGLKPIHYRKARDIRTLVDLAGVQRKNHQREGTHHDALDDAKFQVKYCVEAFRTLS